ncbi:MAG: FAD:protein FMN transferase [Bacteroidia bacterium]|nr:FAD:protein FMN transferase [Bacteroidia bacterium]
MKRLIRLFTTLHRVICFCGLSGVCCGNNVLFSQQTGRFTFEHPQMGTTFRIVLYAENEAIAQNAAGKAFARIDSLNQSMSDYLPDSEISRLAAQAGTGTYQKVSSDLWNVLVRSQQVSRYSKGAFDVTIGPLSLIWRRAMRQQVLPSEEQIWKAVAKVNYKNLQLRKKDLSVMLKQPGMKLDLGAIAKGYASDKAYEVLLREGIPVALVDGGGGLRLGAPPPGQTGWKVEIFTQKETPDTLRKTLYLSHCGVATSGDTYKYVEADGKRYSHIIDPRTGYGIQSRRLVTVVAPDGMDADALATTLSIVGAEKGKKIAHKLHKKNQTALYFTEIH